MVPLIRNLTDVESANLSLLILEIMKNLAFVSVRFGYSAFDEWNFVYFASIDLLSFNPPKAITFLEKHIPGTSMIFPNLR